MADNTTPAVKPGYKTSEFWLTLASVLVGTSFLFGVIGSEAKDTLTSSLQHGVESVFLIGGQAWALGRYIKSRKDAKVAAASEEKEKEHKALLEEVKKEQEATFAARVAQLEAELETKLAAEKAKIKKKPAAPRRKKRPPK